MSRLSLRKFEANDFKEYYRLVSNESVMAMITERAIPLNEAKENYQKVLVRNKKFTDFGTYKVYNDRKEFIGLGSLILNEEKLDEAELGYMLLPEHWGHGYGSKIAEVLVHTANKTEINRLTAIIDPNNVASKKILIKMGFVSEKICEIGGLPGEILSKVL